MWNLNELETFREIKNVVAEYIVESNAHKKLQWMMYFCCLNVQCQHQHKKTHQTTHINNSFFFVDTDIIVPK